MGIGNYQESIGSSCQFPCCDGDKTSKQKAGVLSVPLGRRLALRVAQVVDRLPAHLRRCAVAIRDSSLRRFATFNRSRRTCAIRPRLAKPLSIGTRLWYNDTAQVAGEA